VHFTKTSWRNSLQKIKVYHFNNGSGGGVFSVIKNLLQFSTDPSIENHIIYTINKETTPHFEMPPLAKATSQQLFYYSPKWNFYYTCKQLAKLLPDDKTVVVAHDWLELGMVSNLGLQNPVVHFVHGNYDYYYDLAKKHEPSTDRFIAVSPVIYERLLRNLPGREKDIHYCRFPVPSVQAAKKENERLKILYCVRSLDDENKQFKILPLINAALKLKGIAVEWTIIGDGISKDEVENLMNQHTGIGLYPSLPNEEVLQLMQGHDLFILPSLNEGFPVTIVEAMKAGMVPLVTNWGDSTGELVIQGETGYYIATGDANGYTDTIALLNADRKLLKYLAEKGIQRANELFDPYENAKKMENVIKMADPVKKQKLPIKVYGSRLDEPWLGNTLTPFIRKAFTNKRNA